MTTTNAQFTNSEANMKSDLTKNLTNTIWLLLAVMTLSSCGYSLRGSDVISSRYTSLGLNLQQRNGEFAQQLQRALEGADVVIVDASTPQGEADLPVLSVSAETVDVRPVTVTARARAAQYEMRLGVIVSLTEGGQRLIDAEELSIQRVYFEDPDNITGTLAEAELIQTEMRRELVNQLLRRIEAAGNPALSSVN
jgi:LPS-assembly lipoprotein